VRGTASAPGQHLRVGIDCVLLPLDSAALLLPFPVLAADLDPHLVTLTLLRRAERPIT
jgi:hypothetical protein